MAEVGVAAGAVGLRLLPSILQVVTGDEGTAEERLGKVRELLMGGGGKLLLMEKTG